MRKEALSEEGYGSTSDLVELMERTPPNFNRQEFNGNLQVYDIKNNSWEILTEPEFEKRAYHNLQLYNNKIFVLGGKRLSSNKIYEYLDDEIEVYDLKKDTILIDHTNPHQAASFASFIYKDNMIVLGGFNLKALNEVETFDLVTGEWKHEGELFRDTERPGLTYNNNIIYIFDNGRLSTYNIETKELCEYLIDLDLQYAELFYKNECTHIYLNIKAMY